MTLTLTYDLDFVIHELPINMQKRSFQLVHKLAWKRRTDTTDYSTLPTNAVGNNVIDEPVEVL